MEHEIYWVELNSNVMSSTIFFFFFNSILFYQICFSSSKFRQQTHQQTKFCAASQETSYGELLG